MRVLYEAAHITDAYLVRNALEQAGLPSFIRGEHLTGALGELPIHDLVQVCVPEVCWPDAQACLLALGLIAAPAPEAGAEGVAGAGEPGWLPA